METNTPMKKILELRLANAVRVGDLDGLMFFTAKEWSIRKDGSEFLIQNTRPGSSPVVARTSIHNAPYWVEADDQSAPAVQQNSRGRKPA